MRMSAVLLLVCLSAAPAAAQDTFKQVWVTQSDSGEVVRGRIIELSKESLALLTPDNRRVEMPLDRVLRIEARGDSLKNGAAIGAAILGGLSLFSCQGATSGGQCAAIAVTNIGMGAIIGVGIDAMNAGRSVLYRKPAASAGPKAALNVRIRF